ncbi:hypothetical protein [Streptomyces californicus]|uniref:hypothetical protein n=1 Tax=Streptomyces californicus TaxID=67351 RepID=UPI00378F0444
MADQDHMAITVTAADLLDGRADPARAYVAKVAAFDPDTARPDNWPDHLALWAEHTRKGN